MTRIKNAVILEGFLGKDPEFLTSKKGNPMVVLTVATRNSYKDKSSNSWVQKDTIWHRSIGFSLRLLEQAENFSKGSLVRVTAELEYRQVQNSEGSDVNVVNLIARNIEVVQKKTSGDQPSEALQNARDRLKRAIENAQKSNPA